MPNHEINNVVILGEPAAIRRFVDEALSDRPSKNEEQIGQAPAKVIDFQRIIPMPEILGRMVSPLEIVKTQEEADRKNAEYNASPFAHLGEEEGDEPVQKIRYITREQHGANIAKHGAADWYHWSTANWGTKWNAYTHTHYELRFLQPYDPEKPVYGRVDLRFETAWSQPIPVFEKIEERWGVKVYAITQDEGGFPDVYFPDEQTVQEADVLRREVTYEFESWESEADEPEVIVVEEATE